MLGGKGRGGGRRPRRTHFLFRRGGRFCGRVKRLDVAREAKGSCLAQRRPRHKVSHVSNQEAFHAVQGSSPGKWAYFGSGGGNYMAVARQSVLWRVL